MPTQILQNPAPNFSLLKDSLQNKLQSFVKDSKTLEKTIAVAIASFLCLTLTFEVSLLSAGIYSLALSSHTLLMEKLSVREKNNEWFNVQNFNFKLLKDFGKKVLIAQFACGIFLTIFNIPNPQCDSKFIVERDLFFIFEATVIAPFTEEVLFRGLLKERLEELLFILSRNGSLISNDNAKLISNIAQGIIFGLLHMHPRQTYIANTIVFAATSAIGILLALTKDRYFGSLIPSISYHALTNAAYCFRMLIIGR